MSRRRLHEPRADRPECTSALADGSRYTPAEVEFLRAVERFQKASRKKFLTHVDHLRIALSLGYRRVEATTGGPA